MSTGSIRQKSKLALGNWFQNKIFITLRSFRSRNKTLRLGKESARASHLSLPRRFCPDNGKFLRWSAIENPAENNPEMKDREEQGHARETIVYKVTNTRENIAPVFDALLRCCTNPRFYTLVTARDSLIVTL